MTLPNDRAESGPTLATALVEYQPGSVVSRTVLKRDSGSITLFAFDAGQGLAEHSTPHEAWIHLLDGEAEVTIGGRAHAVAAGECIALPAAVPHALRAVRRFKMMLVMLRSD